MLIAAKMLTRAIKTLQLQEQPPRTSTETIYRNDKKVARIAE